MPKTLPTFLGYTIDAYFGEFRKIRPGKPPLFLDFRDRRGLALLTVLQTEKPLLYERVMHEFFGF